MKRVRRRAGIGAVAVVAALSAALAGCSSASSAGGSSQVGSGGSSAPGVTANSVTLGLLSSFTGSVSAGLTGVAAGFDARIDLQNAEGGVYGRQLKVVEGDDQSTTSGMLTAAQTLVEGKQVFAIGADSSQTYAAESYLKQQGVPITGLAQDGPEWSPPDNNMFPVAGSPSTKFPAAKNMGEFFKEEGATNVAAVGYNVPSAIAAAKNLQVSAKAAGLQSSYINTTIPISQEGDFGAVVQQMQADHVDGVFIEMEGAANFALLEAMHQAGMHVKVYLLDYIQPPDSFQNSTAKADAQGSWAPSPWVPTQLNTPATKAFVAALAKYQHFTSAPDQNVYAGWAAASALIEGLQVAGKSPTRASFIAGLRKVNDFTADGVIAGTTSFTASFGTGAEGPGPYPGECYYYEQYEGVAYTLPNPEPICGGLIPNSDAS
jgi:branched-chain amino acid transport system substrate-binding protein